MVPIENFEVNCIGDRILSMISGTRGELNLPDDKDLRIVDSLIRDHRLTIVEVAKQLGFAPPTVQRRLLRLIDSGVVERGVRICDWSAVGYPLRYWIDLKVNHRALQQGRGGPPGNRQVSSMRKLASYIMRAVGDAYEAKRQLIVQDVTILLGSPADLSVYIRARDHHTVLDFISNGLGALGAVESTRTFHEVWSCSEGRLDQ